MITEAIPNWTDDGVFYQDLSLVGGVTIWDTDAKEMFYVLDPFTQGRQGVPPYGTYNQVIRYSNAIIWGKQNKVSNVVVTTKWELIGFVYRQDIPDPFFGACQ